MGVDLGDLLTKKKIQIEDLSGRWVAVDAFNTLYQFLASFVKRMARRSWTAQAG